MKRIIVAVQFIALMFLLISGVVFADTQLPQNFKFGSKLYKLEISQSGLWTVHPGGKALGMVWVWPAETSGGKYNTPAPIEEITGVEEEKGNDIVFKVNGSTADHIFDYEIICSDNEMKVTYNFEAKKKLDFLRYNFAMSGNFIKDTDYEWGTEEGVPEGKGTISAEEIKVEGSAKYFKFYDFNGCDVTFTFNEGSLFKILAEQWHTFSQDPSKVALSFEMYPTDMDKGITLKKGTKGKVSFTISFASTGKKVEKKSDTKKK